PRSCKQLWLLLLTNRIVARQGIILKTLSIWRGAKRGVTPAGAHDLSVFVGLRRITSCQKSLYSAIPKCWPTQRAGVTGPPWPFALKSSDAQTSGGHRVILTRRKNRMIRA